MPRLEGEKQSVLPYILGIALIAAVGAGAYFYTQSNQANNAANNTTETFTRPNPTSVGNATTENSTNENSVSENSASDNSVSGSAMSGNTTTGNSTTGNATSGNTTTNSVSRTTPTTSVTGGSSP